MNNLQWMTLYALVLCLQLPQPVSAGAFVDVLDTPAQQSAMAANGMLNGLTQAGNRLVAVGQRGHIIYSDDAGQHWQQAKVPVSSDLLAVHFPSPRQGWAVGHDGVVLHSEDGGASWTQQLNGREIGARLLKYYQQRAAEQPDNAASATGIREAERMVSEGADKPFLDVWFKNEQVGYIVGAFGLIFHTTDGGLTWTPWLDRTDNPGALNFYAIRPAGNDLYIAGEQGLLLKLDAAASRFVAIPTPYNGSYFGILGTADTVIVFGLRGNVYRTTDGGANWSHVPLDLSLNITAASRLNDGRIALFSQAGHILLSSDQGASFTPLANKDLQPVAAAAATGTGLLVLAGAQGVYRQTLK